MNCAAGSGEVGMWPVRKCKGCRRQFLVLEGCVLFALAKVEFLGLFPTPNESSFRTLTLTLTCLLAEPQEGNEAALAPCLPG